MVKFYYALQDVVIVQQDIAKIAFKLMFQILQLISALFVVIIVLNALQMIQMYALLVSMAPIYHHPNVYYVVHNALNVLIVQLIVCNVLLEDILILEIRPAQIV